MNEPCTASAGRSAALTRGICAQLIGSMSAQQFGAVFLAALQRCARCDWAVCVIHLVCIAFNDLPRAYEPAAAVGAASFGHERTKGESRGLSACCLRRIVAVAAMGVLLSPPLWKASVAYRRALYHLPRA